MKRWAAYAGLDPRRYSSHSLRRSKAAETYRRTGNLAAVQQLLGHVSIANTGLYLGLDKRQALDLAKKVDF